MTLGAFVFWQSMDEVHVRIALHQDENLCDLYSNIYNVYGGRLPIVSFMLFLKFSFSLLVFSYLCICLEGFISADLIGLALLGSFSVLLSLGGKMAAMKL
ncbi:hypothetical protein D8674_010376 [Pyrus ussuriensis x Pyrus communis]|uniref:Uncharacterized protein n=1 Tax=Pyrus ussuriensis x Pyrus communis TaxID=2448454 RepID=A0A5N5FAK6_9ROSA|nr:hypothetical protein D8674_010376 [Pyrus ussuriensis x Pyrus communis]